MKGIYIHIPFCEQRCQYCDFTTMVANLKIKKAYLDSLKKELVCRLEENQAYRLADTIFIGGGTPSALDKDALESLLVMIVQNVNLDNVLEYTVECNPNSLDEEKIDLLYHYGVTRLSLGVQSFNDNQLKQLGRLHDSKMVLDLVPKLYQKGFKRVNLDLMYGLPKMTLADWEANLKQAVALNVDHLSLYQLKIEKGTPFYHAYEKGALEPFPDDLASDMLTWHTTYLAECGYTPYEVSNFAKPGQASLHNQLYWQLHDYLGLGLGATSFLRPKRLVNQANLTRYLENPLTYDRVEVLSEKEQMSETMFMGLRQTGGISKNRFFSLYGKTIAEVYSTELDELIKKGLLQENEKGYHLTTLGRHLANEVFMAFV